MRNQKPAWWMLYAIVPLMLGALVWNALDGVRGVWGEVGDAAIIVGGFGLMMLWVRANQTALWNDSPAGKKMKTRRRRQEHWLKVRSNTQLEPRVRLPEPQPRTGFGSARGKRYRVRVQETVARDIIRISHIEVEE